LAPEFLHEILVIFILSAVIVYLFGKIRIPSIVGFLFSGVLLGPGGLSIVHDRAIVEALAEVGVALLLFTVGLEFSLSKISKMSRMVLIGGPIQVLLTIIVITGVVYSLTGNINLSIFSGFLVSLSSTAVVLKILMDKGEIHTKQGADITALLVFQDLAVIPMMLFTPLLAGQGADAAMFVRTIGTGAALIGAVFAGSKWIIPWILHETVRTRNRELFIIVVLLLSLGTAYLSHEAGLSLALGAFLAGIMISDSEYSNQVVADILPFRDSLNSLFFVSIGMLLELQYVFQNPGIVLFVTLGIILVKFPAAALPAVLFKYPIRIAIITGFSLAQIGEFSFILLQFGKEAGLDLGGYYQPFLAGAILTMAGTPFMMKFAEKLGYAYIDSIDKKMKRKEPESPFGKYAPKKEHVVIIGFGITGQNIARVLKSVGIDYNILEMNPGTVTKFSALGEPIHYGDATMEHVLSHVGAESARLFVVAISDPVMERRIIPTARRLNPKLHIIARTRFLAEVGDLMVLGADEVITEEFETSIEIFAHVLNHFGVTKEVLGQQVESVRKSAYLMLRTMNERPEAPKFTAITEKKAEIELKVPEGSSISGKKVSECRILEESGVTLVGVMRGGDELTDPDASFVFQAGDILRISGDPRQCHKAEDIIKTLTT